MRFIDTSNVQRRGFNIGTGESTSLTVEIDRSGETPVVSLILANDSHHMKVNARLELDQDDLAGVIAAVDAECQFNYRSIKTANFAWQEGAHSLRVVADTMGEPFRYGVSFDYVERKGQNGDFASAFVEDRDGRELVTLLKSAQVAPAIA